MIDFYKKYKTAKKNANLFMNKGHLSAYLNALLEMSKYKRLMIAVIAN